MALSKERCNEIAWEWLVLIAKKEPIRAIIEFQNELREMKLVMDIPSIEFNFTRLIFESFVIKTKKNTNSNLVRGSNIFNVKSVAWDVFIAWKFNTEEQVIIKTKDERKILGMSTKEAIEFAKLANKEINRRHIDITSMAQAETI